MYKFNLIDKYIIFYVIGHICNTFEIMLKIRRIQDFLCEIQNIIELIIISFFIAAFTLKYISHYNVKESVKWWQQDFCQLGWDRIMLINDKTRNVSYVLVIYLTKFFDPTKSGLFLLFNKISKLEFRKIG